MSFKKLIWFGLNGLIILSGIALFFAFNYRSYLPDYRVASILAFGLPLVAFFNVFYLIVRREEISEQTIINGVSYFVFAFLIDYFANVVVELSSGFGDMLNFVASVILYSIVTIIYLLLRIKLIKPKVRKICFVILTILFALLVSASIISYFMLGVDEEHIWYIISHSLFVASLFGGSILILLINKLN